MRWSRMLTILDVHAEGEIGRVVTGGLGPIPGATMLEKMRHINEVDDTIRRFTVYEPRGSAQATVNLLLPPCDPRADAGFIVLQADRAHAMSGSNSMCVTTALLETGMVAMSEPTTRLTLDTPAGLVGVTAACRDGRCERVTLDMPPSFVAELDITLDVDGIGKVRVDVAFGGVFYALVDARAVGLEITRAQARRLVELGSRIKRAVNAEVRVTHPTLPGIDHVSYVMFCDRDRADARLLRGATIVLPGRCDRSPCGTGNAARLAVLHARGEVGVGETLRARSVIDSEFDVAVREVTQVAGRPAVLPRISGRAWIFGVHHCGLDPADPYPLGFTLSDMWGPDVHVTD
jgi:proline racemase